MRRFASLFGRRGVLAAATVGGAVVVLLVVQDLVGAFVSTVVGYSIGAMPGDYLGIVWQSQAYSFYAVALPLGVGVFASLWLIAPIAAELRLAHVVTRGILAAGIGASLVVIVTAVLGLVRVFSGVGSLFSFSFPAIDLQQVLQTVTMALQAGIGAFLTLGTTVVLAGVFLWLWLQKHPSRHAVSGMIDEV